jgi:hypothetical protein
LTPFFQEMLLIANGGNDEYTKMVEPAGAG